MSKVNTNGQNDLPGGWVSASLEEVCQINPPLDRCIVSDTVEVNFVPMRAVEPEGGGLVRPELRSYGEVKKGYTSFLSGDVIMAKITPCMENGKTTVVPELSGSICFGSTEFHVMRPECGMAARWVASFLLQHETRRAAQRAMTGGVGQMRVPAAFLEAVRVPVAPSAEQERIADALDELLSDLDAGVAALDRVRQKLKLYRASVLKAAVEGTLTAEWRKRHPHVEPASELLKRILAERRGRWEEDQLRKFKAKGQEPPKNWRSKYKEPVEPDTTNQPDLPTSYCWASFDQIGETQGGLQKSPGRKPTKTHYPYLRVANVHRGSLDLRQLHRFELTDEELERLRLQPGDLLIVEGNGSRTEIGRCAIWRGEVEDCVHQNHIIRVRPLTGVNPNYVNLFLNSPDGQKAIQWVASSTSGLYTLSIGKIEKLPLALPPTDEQEAIVESVEDQLSIVDHLEADLDAKLKSTQALRQAILRHAFTGKLALQDPSEEPAFELLKRIAAEREQRAREAAAAKRSNGRQPRRASMARIQGKAGRAITKETVNGRIADR
jgi:type I restriction enzyme, S subunit